MPSADQTEQINHNSPEAGTGRLVGKTAFLTGSAGGLGSGIARRMFAEGARVALADIDIDSATAIADELDASGKQAFAFKLNVSNSTEVRDVVDAVQAWGGSVDILVNCAGVNSHHPALELPEEEWDRVIEINLKGTFLVSQAVGRVMKPHTNATIINISSTSAEVARSTSVHYAASKGGVRQLTKGFAAALAPSGIRVNAIGPGPVLTSLNERRLSDPDELKRSLERVALGRLGTPWDIAGAAMFLATEDAAFITGTTIYVEGGLLSMR